MVRWRGNCSRHPALWARRCLVAGIVLGLNAMWWYPALPRTLFYPLLREFIKKSTVFQVRTLSQQDSEHFEVRYQVKDQEWVNVVIEASEAAYEPVNKLLAFKPNGLKLPIILYPDQISLGRSFGWAGNEGAMGVYWAGTIRVLSPGQWLHQDGEEAEAAFNKEGPMAHEYTHLVVDYLTAGNYPRWFTEGVAQYVEREVTGFQFARRLQPGEKWYSLEQLSRSFDSLPDQSLAYYQSLAMIERMVEARGMQGLRLVMADLGRGKAFSWALEKNIALREEELISLIVCP